MERRRYLRIEIDLPGDVQLFSGMRLPVRIRNLSRGGAQIQCDALDSEIIAPGGSCLDESGRPIELDLSLSVGDRTLLLSCRVIFVRRVSHSEYRIGLRYVHPPRTELLEVEKLLRDLS